MNSTSTIVAIAVAVMGASLALANSAATSAPRPNIVFILGDDLGYDNIGCNGSKFYKEITPHIDRLASAGMRFKHCYATGICSPSRAQYATGQYPFRNGTLDIDGSGLNRKDDASRPSLTQILNDAGYTTGKCGKSDLGSGDPDEQLTGWQYWDKNPAKWKLVGPSKLKPEDYEYFPSAKLDFALDFIERNHPRPENGNKPFYFLFGFNSPHIPIERTPDSAPGTTDISQLYKDNLRYIDKVTGAIVEKLRENGCLDNTIILVSGDNGSLNAHNRTPLQSPILDSKSGKYRKIDGSKADRAGNREGTALVPLVIHWPKGIEPKLIGSVSGEFIDFTDFLPTFADFAGATIDPKLVIDGHSFYPLLKSDPTYKPREWVYHQIENNWCLRGPGYRLNRNGKFYDMSDAPFSMKEITEPTPEQKMIRDKYQNVLDRFDPANGLTYEGHQDSEWKNPAWDWKSKHFGTEAWNTPIAGDISDPDGDGVTNIFERAFGWDPKKSGDVMPAASPSANGALEIIFPLREGNDVRVIAEASPDGIQWTALEPSGTGPFTAAAKQGQPTARLRLRAERITPWKEP